jgi:hypothetical protein
MKPILVLAAAAAATAVPALAEGDAPFVVQETRQGFGSLQQALDSIGNGSGTIVIAPGRYRQCGVQKGGDVAFVAAQPGTAVFDGVACDGKAALVLDGRRSRVEGLVFQNIRVPDANGAGIRMESGDLVVRETMFRNSESGILSAADPGSTITVDQSTFSGLGRCDRGLSCAHSIYIGDYGALVVRRSRFERGRGGHYVKSRTPRVEVSDSSFDDTAGHVTNYMIDLPAGSTGLIARNVFVQGRDKENYSGLIVVGAETISHSADGLAIEGNDASLAPAMEHGTTFVVDYTGDRLRIGANRLGPRIARFEKR